MTLHVVTDTHTCAACVSKLLQATEVAVDLEGVGMNRHGSICLIQIAAAASPTVLFDITTMGALAFSDGNLKQLLESNAVTKVIFDGRADNDALFHQYGFVMQNVYDVQVLQMLTFAYHRGQGLADPQHLKGLEKCLELSCVMSRREETQLRSIRDRGKRIYLPEHGGRLEAWRERPLRPELLEYAAADVPYLLDIKRVWSSPELDPHVASIAQRRIFDAARGPNPAEGSHMRKRDFDLPHVCTQSRSLQAQEALRLALRDRDERHQICSDRSRSPRRIPMVTSIVSTRVGVAAILAPNNTTNWAAPAQRVPIVAAPLPTSQASDVFSQLMLQSGSGDLLRDGVVRLAIHRCNEYGVSSTMIDTIDGQQIGGYGNLFAPALNYESRSWALSQRWGPSRIDIGFRTHWVTIHAVRLVLSSVEHMIPSWKFRHGGGKEVDTGSVCGEGFDHVAVTDFEPGLCFDLEFPSLQDGATSGIVPLIPLPKVPVDQVRLEFPKGFSISRVALYGSMKRKDRAACSAELRDWADAELKSCQQQAAAADRALLRSLIFSKDD